MRAGLRRELRRSLAVKGSALERFSLYSKTGVKATWLAGGAIFDHRGKEETQRSQRDFATEVTEIHWGPEDRFTTEIYSLQRVAPGA